MVGKVNIPAIFYLYDGSNTEALRIEEISQYLRTIFRKSETKTRQEFVFHHFSYLSSPERRNKTDELAEEFASIKIRDIEKKDSFSEPLAGEVEYQRRRISNPESKSWGVVYDGFKLRGILAELIPESESNLRYCHISFTNQLFATWDETDKRNHLRASIYGFPSIISVTGIVEAPAKPREFYLKQRLGIEKITLKREFAARFIDYNDPRLTEIMKGYILQAIFYQMGEKPFCDDKNCRLYNAHWQEELIQAQLDSPYEFCPTHRCILRELRGE